MRHHTFTFGRLLAHELPYLKNFKNSTIITENLRRDDESTVDADRNPFIFHLLSLLFFVVPSFIV